MDEPDQLKELQAVAARMAAEGTAWELDVEPPAEGVPVASATREASAEVPAGGIAPGAEERPAELPPQAEQIVEALLFVGGPPLDAPTACRLIRNLAPSDFQKAIDALNRKYRSQGRPYMIRAAKEGYSLAILPRFAPLRERLQGGPKQVRLSAAALDTLAIIAYQQPIRKAAIDAALGAECGPLLRSLIRLGLVTMQSPPESDAEAQYVTTPRMLSLFGLQSLDDLPRLGKTERL